MKKICKKCGKNRRIGKFGKDKRMFDGKRIYCKDCIRILNKKAKSTIKGKEVNQKTIKKWKDDNKDKIKKYNKEYYQKKKDIILYNRKAKKETEDMLIIGKSKKNIQIKINNDRKEYIIKIDPKRKING